MTSDHPTVEETAAFAGALFADHRDKAGAPYIGHLARAARHLARLFPEATIAERHAVWLHDALEDTDTTAQDLAARGYDPLVIEIVEAVTRRADSDSYQQWIEALAESGFAEAIRVKLADMTDNADPQRLAALPPEKAASLGKRYARARRTLEVALEKITTINDDDGLRLAEHVPLTLILEPADHYGISWGAQIADRTPEDFVIEESRYLADMLILTGLHQVRLARHHLAEAADFHEAFRRTFSEDAPASDEQAMPPESDDDER